MPRRDRLHSACDGGARDQAPTTREEPMTTEHKPHIKPDELVEAREIATTWTTNAPAIRMAVLVLDLEEQFDSLREAAAKTLHEYDLWAEDANDGEFAIWSRDEFMASFVGLRNALIWAGAASSPASSPEEEAS